MAKHSKERKKKISEKMLGNTNAEIWSEEVVCDMLNKMWDFSKKEIEIRTKRRVEKGFSGENESKKDTDEFISRKTHLKESLLIHFDIKNPKWFAHMRTKFRESLTVCNLLDCIDMICTVNTYEDAANNKTNVAIAKMHLSHHYGWKDTSSLDINDSRAKSDEQLDKELEEYEKRNKK